MAYKCCTQYFLRVNEKIHGSLRFDIPEMKRQDYYKSGNIDMSWIVVQDWSKLKGIDFFW